MHIPSTITPLVSLASYTTLGVGGVADYFAIIDSMDELEEAVLWARHEGYPVTVLGGGSNVLVASSGVRGLVIHVATQHRTYVRKGTDVAVTVDAGVVLDDLIAEVVDKGLWGLENLSAIPGTVGAVPVQNVGAYGVEAKDVIAHVTAYDIENNHMRTFSPEECAFAYRDSYFKRPEGKRYIITEVTFVLHTTPTPQISYRDIASYFGTHTTPSLADIRTAVVDIRREKLPDWHVVGTAGSFFKNPIVTSDVFDSLVRIYPDLPGFPDSKGNIKVSLGWILDRVCGLRGYQVGNVGLYEKQALVLVCESGATTDDIESFVQDITARVYAKTGLTIEQEVQMFE